MAAAPSKWGVRRLVSKVPTTPYRSYPLTVTHSYYSPKGSPAGTRVCALLERFFHSRGLQLQLSYYKAFCSYFSPRNCPRHHHSIVLCWCFLDFTHWFYASLQLSSNNPVDIISISLAYMTKLQHKEAGYFPWGHTTDTCWSLAFSLSSLALGCTFLKTTPFYEDVHICMLYI